MEFTFRSNRFDICVRLGRTFNVQLEKYLGSAINVRVGNVVWSTGKGLRKLGNA